MFVLEHDRFGRPADVLELKERPDPVPSSGEVLIAIEATPIHAGDLKNIHGERTMVRDVDTGVVREVSSIEDTDADLPQVPGIEGIGRIETVGPGVSGFKPGDRVFLPFQCGSWRTKILVQAERLIRAPEGDGVQLSLMVNAFTADLALRDLAPLKPGDWFVQNSANSNVGRILIALAARRGIKTLNIVRRASLVDELKAIGATEVIVEGDRMMQAAADATRGAPLMIGLDGIAGAATGQLAEILSNGATVANFGLMSGRPCEMPSWVLHYKRTKLIGYYAGHNFFQRTVDEQRALIEELAALIADGTLQTKICKTYRFEEYRQAVEHAEDEGAARDGKIVLIGGN